MRMVAKELQRLMETNMNVIIFAGGAGTRLWPLSRKATPKQFAPFFDGKSTLQLAIDRIEPFGLDHVFISTNKDYVELLKGQVSGLAEDHIFEEPSKRDLAAAIGLSLMRLKKRGVSGTLAMIWSDHLMDRPDEFVDALKHAGELIAQDPERFIFIGERARYAEQNLGWINVGEKTGDKHHAFLGWKYRPDKESCDEMFASGNWMWNPGYFVYDIDFVLGLYEKHQPEMFKALERMIQDEETIPEEYGKLESLSFDNAIVEKVDNNQAVVIPVDMGWSDPGTLYAMKEALQEGKDDNVVKGNAICHESKDCFVYNEEDHKLVTTVGLEGVIVVNTGDSIMVCHKDHVPKIKDLLKKVEDEGYSQNL